jgi:hypothetical protein
MIIGSRAIFAPPLVGMEPHAQNLHAPHSVRPQRSPAARSDGRGLSHITLALNLDGGPVACKGISIDASRARRAASGRSRLERTPGQDAPAGLGHLEPCHAERRCGLSAIAQSQSVNAPSRGPSFLLTVRARKRNRHERQPSPDAHAFHPGRRGHSALALNEFRDLKDTREIK